MLNFGEWLKEKRIEKGLTLEEIADKMFYSLITIKRAQRKALNVVADLCGFQDD